MQKEIRNSISLVYTKIKMPLSVPLWLTLDACRVKLSIMVATEFALIVKMRSNACNTQIHDHLSCVYLCL